MIRILLADDYTVIRKGVRQILTQAYPNAEIEEIEEGEEWTDKLKACAWDMIISDVPGVEKGGFNVLEHIRQEFPGLPVLILSLYTKEHYAFKAMRAGAAGYLGKDAAPDELLWAVRQILSGKKCITIPAEYN